MRRMLSAASVALQLAIAATILGAALGGCASERVPGATDRDAPLLVPFGTTRHQVDDGHRVAIGALIAAIAAGHPPAAYGGP